MKKIPQSKQKKEKPETKIELIFDGRKVSGAWFHPKLADVICALCGKNCDILCHNVNPYCG